jgi:hypothetical protein
VPSPPPSGGGRFLPPPPPLDAPTGEWGGNVVIPTAPPEVNLPAPAPVFTANCQGLPDTYGVGFRGGYACLERPVSMTPSMNAPSYRANNCRAYPGSRRIRLRGGFACF